MPRRMVVPDLPRQFKGLNGEGEALAVRAGFDGPDFADDRYSVDHDGLGIDNHFQGIRRIGQHLFLTGSYPYRTRRGDLFVLEMGSRNADPGPWGSNLIGGRPPDTDRLANYYAIDRTYWHPGSPALLGDTLVVPLERAPKGDSLLAFLDLTTPDRPAPAAPAIVRPSAKAGAVAATSLPSGHLLLAAWSDSDLGNGPCHCDFYISEQPQDPRGFRLVGMYWPPVGSDFSCKFQGLDLVWDEAAPDGRLFVLGFYNPVRPQPQGNPGQNRVDLFELSLPGAWRDPDNIPDGPPAVLPADLVHRIDRHVFTYSGDWFSTDAGAGAYVDSNQQLIVYSVAHHRNPVAGRLAVKCMEFRSTDFADSIVLLEDAWVELYEGPGATGRRLTLLGPWESSLANAADRSSEDPGWLKVAAVRFQIPEGTAYVLYPARDFQGSGALVLVGTGRVEGIPLAGDRPYRMRSGRFLPVSVALALPDVRTPDTAEPGG
jgi:hypothetical protein